MKTIRELYGSALEHKEELLSQIIELLVLEKKVLHWDEEVDRIYYFINPPEGKRKAWNQRYIEELSRMK